MYIFINLQIVRKEKIYQDMIFHSYPKLQTLRIRKK